MITEGSAVASKFKLAGPSSATAPCMYVEISEHMHSDCLLQFKGNGNYYDTCMALVVDGHYRLVNCEHYEEIVEPEWDYNEGSGHSVTTTQPQYILLHFCMLRMDIRWLWACVDL